MKPLPWLVFASIALAQWIAPLLQIWRHERTISHGTLFKFKCSAPDPYDLLRGRYLAVRPVESSAMPPAGAPMGQNAFVELTVGSDGFAKPGNLSITPPTSGDYLDVKIRYAFGDHATIEWPFDRFYLNEKLAPQADQWFAEHIRSDKGIVAEVRVFNGRGVLTDLTYDNKSVLDILKAQSK